MNLSLGIYIGDLSQFRLELQQQLSQRIYLSSDREDKINQYFSVNIHRAIQHRDIEQSTNKNAQYIQCKAQLPISECFI